MFSCAQKFVQWPSTGSSPIAWHTVVSDDPDSNEGCSSADKPIRANLLAHVLSFNKYLERMDASEQLSIDLAECRDEFHDWRVYVDVQYRTVPLLCCNEDVIYNESSKMTASYETHLTVGSKIPLCNACGSCLEGGGCPPAALVNDMWTGYIPAMFYTDEVSAIEMVCASPFFTSMICFSLDIRYGALKNDTRHSC